MYLFLLEKKGRTAVKNADILTDDALCILMALTDDTGNLPIDLSCHFLTVASGMCQITADKYLIVIVAVSDQTDFFQTYRISLP